MSGFSEFSMPSGEELDAATPEQRALLAAACLERLDPGRQPLPLFTQFGRHVVLSTAEIAFFKADAEEPEVLLSQRPEDCPWWPNEWHVPGATLLPTDEIKHRDDYETPVDRMLREEFSSSVSRRGLVRMFEPGRRGGPRGREQTGFGWAEVDLAEGLTEPVGGQFFPIDQLPDQLVSSHDVTVERAVVDYLAFKETSESRRFPGAKVLRRIFGNRPMAAKIVVPGDL